MTSRRTRWLLRGSLTVALVAAGPVHAQRPAVGGPRFWVSAWAGGFTDLGGFSQEDFFLQFDGTIAWGAGAHVALRSGMVIGVDGLFARPEYARFDRTSAGPELGRDRADVSAWLASVRFQGNPGPLGVFFTGAAGLVSWDVPDFQSKNTDPALSAGLGLELRMRLNFVLFAEYGSWWIYHEKTEDVVRNTVRGTVLRAGARFGLL